MTSGAKNVSDAWRGKDLFTGKELSTGDRILRGLSGIADLVLARHENSNVQSYEKVVQLFVSDTSKLVRIKVGSEMIETTEERPFYLPRKG